MRRRLLPEPLRQTLVSPRYLRLFAVVSIVALVCIGAGTWQIARFEGKVRDNNALTANAHAATVPVGSVLSVGSARSADRVRYRTVVATGTYDNSDRAVVRLRTVNGAQVYFVLTPLVTPSADLLVVRGYVPQEANGNAPAVIAAAPTGTVTVRARAQTPESGDDHPAGNPPGELSTINPALQAARLGRGVYDGWVELLAGQPGVRGTLAIPPPDLSNPAGGAVEPQHFAYIIQWYLFALLALSAPLILARAENRERDREDEERGVTPKNPVTDADRRAAKLVDRYGRA